MNDILQLEPFRGTEKKACCFYQNLPRIVFRASVFLHRLTFAFQINRVTGDFVTDASGNPVLRSDSGAVWALAGICILLIALYLVLILLSRKTRVTLYIAFGLFMLDTLLVLLTGLNFSMLFNLAFHAWVLYSFVVIIRAENKIRRLYPNAG